MNNLIKLVKPMRIPNRKKYFFGVVPLVFNDFILRSKALDDSEQLILLDPLPESMGMNHDFQNPVFEKKSINILMIIL